jgi:hypothetical protein
MDQVSRLLQEYTAQTIGTAASVVGLENVLRKRRYTSLLESTKEPS